MYNCQAGIALQGIFKYLWNMKLLFLCLFFTGSLDIMAQGNTDTLSSFYDLNGGVNVTVYLLNKGSITGDVWKFNDSCLIMYGINNAGMMELKNISYVEMRIVKIRRYAFAKGVIAGGRVGGWVSDQVINSAGYNALSLKTQSQALAVQASAAIIGGVFNSAVKKKKFKVNGDKGRFEKVFRVLLQAH